MTPGVDPGSEQFSEKELQAGIHEAHKAGKKTATHAQGTQGILNALHAGVDSIEHGIYLDEEAISLLVRHEVPYIPTISALYNIEKKGIEAGIPGFVVEKTQKVKAFHLESVHMAREAGVRVAMGTDAGTPFNAHGENLSELLRLVESGFSATEAFQSGTRIAASVLGMEKDLGTVEEGKLADLVEEIQWDPDVKVIILKGIGRAFGVGGDANTAGMERGLTDEQGKPTGERPPQWRQFAPFHMYVDGPRGIIQTLNYCTKATIAQVHGYCYGGHICLAMACDITIASEEAIFAHAGYRYMGPSAEGFLAPDEHGAALE